MAVNTKFTDEVIERLEYAIRLGSVYEHACNYAGITYQTFRNWMLAGEKARSGKKREFYNRMKQAEGDATSHWLEMIENAAQEGNWQAAAWKLERRYPANYGRQTKQQVEQQNISLEVDFNDLTVDQLKRLANGENLVDVLTD